MCLSQCVKSVTSPPQAQFLFPQKSPCLGGFFFAPASWGKPRRDRRSGLPFIIQTAPKCTSFSEILSEAGGRSPQKKASGTQRKAPRLFLSLSQGKDTSALLKRFCEAVEGAGGKRGQAKGSL